MTMRSTYRKSKKLKQQGKATARSASSLLSQANQTYSRVAQKSARRKSLARV
jgi:hypothetical protein